MSQASAQEVWRHLDEDTLHSETESSELVLLLRSMASVRNRWRRDFPDNIKLDKFEENIWIKSILRLFVGPRDHLWWVDHASEWLYWEKKLAEEIQLKDYDYEDFFKLLRADPRIAPDGLPARLEELESYNLSGLITTDLHSVDVYEMSEQWCEQIRRPEKDRKEKQLRIAIFILGISMCFLPVILFINSLGKGTILLAPHFPILFIGGAVALSLAVKWKQV